MAAWVILCGGGDTGLVVDYLTENGNVSKYQPNDFPPCPSIVTSDRSTTWCPMPTLW